MTRLTSLLTLTFLATVGIVKPAQAQEASMNFFLTNVGPGNGADLGSRCLV
jgi:hypothetical protein